MASMQNHHATTTIQSRLVSGARAGCKVMINATYGRKMQPAMHAATARRRRALIAPRRRATSFISRAVSYFFFEIEFEICASLGSAGQFRVLVFLVLFITTGYLTLNWTL